jgi:spermidine synthase
VKKKPAVASEAGISQGLRRYMYWTAAFTGGAIMVIEILGAKLLAPYVGTSHFVWTAQISVTLLALAAGYYGGGWMVDRSPRLGQLYGGLWLASIYLCLTVLAVEPVAYWCLQFPLAMGSLLASSFLFFLPLSLLAMVAPFFVRFLAISVSGVGGTVGGLIAISTLGSVVGTILISYVLIPLLPNSVTMYLTAATLMLLAGGYLLVRQRTAVAILVIVSLVGLGLGYLGARNKTRFANSVEIERINSPFGLLQVVYSKDGRARFLLNDFLLQNVYDPIERKSRVLFTYMLHGLATGYTREIHEVLCIGMGIGIVPMEFVRDGAKVDAVEVNKAVVRLAEKHFDLATDRVRVTIAEGRYFVNRCTNRYDTVILDAFLGDSSPSHLMTREAFQEIHRILRPTGTLVINSFGDFRAGHDFLVASLEKTLRAVFKSVRVHHDPFSADFQNVFFVASDQPQLQFIKSIEESRIHPTWRRDVLAGFAGVVQTNPNHGRILTDDYNPSEFYDATNREQFRRKLVQLISQL